MRDAGERAWKAGDSAGFLAALNPWQVSTSQILCRILGNRHDADDVWQTLVLRWWRTTDQPSAQALPAWLRRCAVNEALRFLREQKRRGYPPMEEVQAAEVDPGEEVAGKELRLRLSGALQLLAPEERALLTLRFDEGLTIREIAEIVERPPATVHIQLERVVSRIRKTLGIPVSESRMS